VCVPFFYYSFHIPLASFIWCSFLEQARWTSWRKHVRAAKVRNDAGVFSWKYHVKYPKALDVHSVYTAFKAKDKHAVSLFRDAKTSYVVKIRVVLCAVFRVGQATRAILVDVPRAMRAFCTTVDPLLYATLPSKRRPFWSVAWHALWSRCVRFCFRQSRESDVGFNVPLVQVRWTFLEVQRSRVDLKKNPPTRWRNLAACAN